jgi:hypothetical protein
MTYFTNYAENKLVDMLRGQAWSLPADLYFGLASAATDSSITELSGTGYAREAITRSLANWSGTQGAGTTTASSGTSHVSSNNVAIDFGTAGAGGWGTASHLVAWDASTSGNALFYLPLDVALPIAESDPVEIEAANVVFRLGLSGGCSDYLANKLIDFILRAQSYSYPASVYVAACTDAPNNAGGGTEPAVGSYARVAVATSLTAWAGTQSAGSTAASSGTGGETSNNAAITFPAPTANYASAITHRKVMDASTGGNLLFWAELTAPKTIVSGGSALFYAAGQLKVRFG